jgi:hypothetical protein
MAESKPPRRSRAELERRLEEIRFMGTQYALGGVEPPPELTTEYEAIQAQLATLPPPRHGPPPPASR